MIDWLDSEASPYDNGDTVYPLNKARSRYDVRELCQGGWLVLNWDQDKDWLKFAVLDFYFSDNEGVRGGCVFHGEGPSKVLRECRHTWWGDKDGYLFYPNGDVIAAAVRALSEFFDMD